MSKRQLELQRQKGNALTKGLRDKGTKGGDHERQVLRVLVDDRLCRCVRATSARVWQRRDVIRKQQAHNGKLVCAPQIVFLSAESTELLQNVDVDKHNDLCIVNILDEPFRTLHVQYFDVSNSDSLHVNEVQYSGSYAEATSVPLHGVVPVGSILWSTTDGEGAHGGFEICRTGP